MEETLRHLRRFRSQGVSELVLTPHLLAADLGVAAMDEVLALHRERFGDMLEAVGEDPAFPRLSLGQEILARTPGDVEKVVGRTDVGLAPLTGPESVHILMGQGPRRALPAAAPRSVA